MDDKYDDVTHSLSDIQSKSTITGPFGIDPLDFTFTCFLLLLLWISYLLLPRGLRVQYFGAYPKRYAWSERMKRRRTQWLHGIGTSRHDGSHIITKYSDTPSQVSVSSGGSEIVQNSKNETTNPTGFMGNNSCGTADSSLWGDCETPGKKNAEELSERSSSNINGNSGLDDETIDFNSPTTVVARSNDYSISERSNESIIQKENSSKSTSRSLDTSSPPPFTSSTSTFNDEIVISSTMQRLRDSGIVVIAHGSRGKPKTVRVQLDENAIMWHSEGRKRKSNKQPKEHRVPLSHIMYVDVGKQTTALRRVENASVPDDVCLSLLTKEGSLDLEVGNTSERDALVGCFSLVLDEVHARNWRDVYRAPSSDLPSSFDEFDVNGEGGVGMRTVKDVYMWEEK